MPRSTPRFTLIEMNDPSLLEPGAVVGGVPCQSNAIERENLQQKQVREWKRSSVVTFTMEVRQPAQPAASRDRG